MKRYIATATIILFLGACGTVNDAQMNGANNQTLIEDINSMEVVSGREIIAKLEQTTTDTTKRDQILAEIKNRNEFKDGTFGEPTDDLAEEMSVQQIEGSIVIPLVEDIYGGYKGLDEAGVIFFENKSQGAEQSGVWIGIKNIDERLQKMVDALQAKVDEGEIQAKYVFIYQPSHTQAENNQLTNEVYTVVERIARHHDTPDRLSMAVSVDAITGEVNIGHNFLTEEQKERLRKQFSEKTFQFKQEGRLAPLPGEPDTFYPEEKYTDELSKEGSYIVALSENQILVVDAEAADYSKNGGEEEFYSATYYDFPNATSKLKIGQRVLVEASGPIMTSYPGQGKALYIDVLPEYKAEGAVLRESQVVEKAIRQAKNSNANVLAIKGLSFDKEQHSWIVQFKQEEEVFEIEVEDK